MGARSWPSRLCDNSPVPRPPTRSTSIHLAPDVAELLGQLAELRGKSKAEIIVTGIVAQGELYGLIPSLTEFLAHALPPESTTDPERLRSLRLSQQRTRARRAGEPVPKLKPGRPRKPSAGTR
jgi:hypothetical protein